MVYEIVYGNIGNCKQLFQTWKTGSFMNGSYCMDASQYSGRFNGSDHEYTLSEPTAVANGAADWLYLSTFPCSKDTLQGFTRFLNSWKTVSHELQFTFLPFILDQTMNTHLLSELQWLVMLTGSISTPFHFGKTLYYVPQASSIPGKQFSHKLQLTFWPFVLYQIMNRDILSPV